MILARITPSVPSQPSACLRWLYTVCVRVMRWEGSVVYKGYLLKHIQNLSLIMRKERNATGVTDAHSRIIQRISQRKRA